MTSRPPPPVFVPFVHDGVRYEPDASAPPDPVHPNAGYLAAIDVASGRKLWSLRIWSFADVPGLSFPGRFFGRVSLGATPDELLVEDEHGCAYVVDRVRRRVRAVPRPHRADAPTVALPSPPRAPGRGDTDLFDGASAAAEPFDDIFAALELSTREATGATAVTEHPTDSDDDDVTSHCSRVGIPSPPAIVFEGKRYEQILNGELRGLSQRTGLMAVTDVATGEGLAVVRVYDYPREPEMESDVGDVFFLSARLDADQREIVVESERRERFAIDVDSGSVRLVAGS